VYFSGPLSEWVYHPRLKLGYNSFRLTPNCTGDTEIVAAYLLRPINLKAGVKLLFWIPSSYSLASTGFHFLRIGVHHIVQSQSVSVHESCCLSNISLARRFAACRLAFISSMCGVTQIEGVDFIFVWPYIVKKFFLITRCISYPNLFRYKTVHVSGIFSAHHQEFSTVHSALVSFMQVWWPLPSRVRMDSAWMRSSILHETYQCRMYSRKLLMIGR
jgi:hypothetical protein